MKGTGVKASRRTVGLPDHLERVIGDLRLKAVCTSGIQVWQSHGHPRNRLNCQLENRLGLPRSPNLLVCYRLIGRPQSDPSEQITSPFVSIDRSLHCVLIS